MNKFFSFFKKYPVILVASLVIPSSISVGQYLFTWEGAFHNEYYQGEELKVDDSKFEITAIKHIGKVSQSSSNFSSGTPGSYP